MVYTSIALDDWYNTFPFPACLHCIQTNSILKMFPSSKKNDSLPRMYPPPRKRSSIFWLVSLLFLCGLATYTLREQRIGNLVSSPATVTIEAKANPTVSATAEIAQVKMFLWGSVADHHNEETRGNFERDTNDFGNLLAKFEDAIESISGAHSVRIAKNDLAARYHGTYQPWKEVNPSDEKDTDLYLSAYDIRFKGMKGLAELTEILGQYENIGVELIEWDISEKTRRALKESLHVKAAQEVTASGLTYARALGLEKVRPIEIREVHERDETRDESWELNTARSRFKMKGLGVVEIPKLKMSSEVSAKFVAF